MQNNKVIKNFDFKSDHAQKTQEFKAVLFTWHEKHPTPGYFQGINDLIVPFLIFFLNEYVQIDFGSLTNIGHLDKITENNYEELAADVYCCVSQLIDMIYQNYLDSQIATAEASNKIAHIVEKIELELSQHLEKEAIESGITMHAINLYNTFIRLDILFIVKSLSSQFDFCVI